ncbi:hypothetical protein [Aestuariispira ectoiniformans]|uniref:hypothetical protein n=1 Tax=Aestuariispira ectoiniformans TaxID=2775080 RepID=UPI00223B91DD|nr:hypothetical protein [Aestuariispira ectoiniformans]
MIGGRIFAMLSPAVLLSACTLVPFEKEAPEDCYWVTLTAEGDYCQAARDQDNKLLSFYADMNGYNLDDEVCICGKPAAMSHCKTGQPMDLSHLGRQCPGPPPAY